MHALRFHPPNQGHWVPARAYAQVIDLIIDGLYKVRHHAAPRIADATGQPKELVRDALEFAIGTALPGSLIVPIATNGGPHAGILGGGEITKLFWDMTQEILCSAAKGTPSIEFSAKGADVFAKAARIALDAGSTIELAKQEPSGWSEWVNLSKLEVGLRTFAERRRSIHAGTAELVGQLVSLHKKPLEFTLETTEGRKTIRMTSALADQARELWGNEVVVEVDGSLDGEGNLAEAKAVAIRPSKTAKSLTKDFASSFGALRDVWGSPEARAYADQLRRKN